MVVLTIELRSANLTAITVAAAGNQARSAAAITALSTLAVQEAPRSTLARTDLTPQSILAPAADPLGLTDRDLAVVACFAAVAVAPTREEAPDQT